MNITIEWHEIYELLDQDEKYELLNKLLDEWFGTDIEYLTEEVFGEL